MIRFRAFFTFRSLVIGLVAIVGIFLPTLSLANNPDIRSQPIHVPNEAVKLFLEERARLDRIAIRIAIAANGQCANRWRHPGFKTHKLRDYPRRLRRDLRGFADRDPQILSVQRSTLRDQILPTDRILDSQARALNSDSLALQVQLALGRLTLLRDGDTIQVKGNWPQLCYRPVRLTSSLEVEGRTTPNAVEISRGLINHARSEDELAYAIAHELSHFMLDHSEILSAAREEGRLSQSLRRALETDADRGAVFLLYKAGYDPNAAYSFMQRTSVLRDIPLLGLSAHPSRSSRLGDIAETIDALNAIDMESDSIGSFVSRFHR